MGKEKLEVLSILLLKTNKHMMMFLSLSKDQNLLEKGEVMGILQAR